MRFPETVSGKTPCVMVFGLAVLTANAHAAIVSAPLIGASRTEPVVVLEAGRQAGLAPGDRVAVVDGEDITSVITAGEIVSIEDAKATARLADRLPVTIEAEGATTRSASTRTAAVPDPHFHAFVVPAQAVIRGKHAMPTETTITATAASVGPGHRQVWLDAGRAAGFEEGDTVWIRRDGFPIACGRIVEVLDRTALVQPRPLVTNAIPDIGDQVELWPSAAMKRTGRPETVVMDVAPNEEGATLTLAGARRDGLKPERPMELFDGDRYVGLAGITTSSDRLCLARSLRAFCATQPTVGLRAVGRPTATRPSAPLAARLFDVRQNYVLISAGNSDGVAIGQTFAVVQGGKTVARLEVRVVEMDFAGADVLPSEDGQPPAELKKWDLAVREPRPPEPAAPIGSTTAVWRSGEWAAAVVRDSPGPIEPETVLRIATSPPTAAIVVHAAGSRLLLYIPPGWGRGPLAPGQRIERTAE